MSKQRTGQKFVENTTSISLVKIKMASGLPDYFHISIRDYFLRQSWGASLIQRKLHHLIPRDDEEFVLVVEDHA